MMVSAFSIHIAVNVYVFAASSVLLKKIDHTAVELKSATCLLRVAGNFLRIAVSQNQPKRIILDQV